MNITAAIQRWWTGRKESRAFDALGSEGRAALARDCGLAEDTLARIVSRGTRGGAELPRLLGAVGLYPESLGGPARRSCARCKSRAPCAWWRVGVAGISSRGLSRATYREYCPDADTSPRSQDRRVSIRHFDPAVAIVKRKAGSAQRRDERRSMAAGGSCGRVGSRGRRLT